MSFSTKRQPISKISNRPPTRSTQINGKIVEEKVAATPYARKFVKPDGNLTAVVLASGRTISGTRDNPYGNDQWAEKISKGWLPYSECPVGRYGNYTNETPCQGISPDKPGIFFHMHESNKRIYVEDKCCKHIEQAITDRQEVYLEKQKEYASQFGNSMDKLVAHMEAQAAKEFGFSKPEVNVNQAMFGPGATENHEPSSSVEE